MTSNILIATAVLVVVILAFRFAYPSRFLRLLLLAMRRVLGFNTRSVDVDGTRWPYLEGGPESGEVLILLHGFGGDKDNWPMYARSLRRKYRVMIPDLPGFGDNSKDPDADYGTLAQAKRLHAFAEKLQLGRFHIGGNSMGGFIALKFALAYPDKILSIALLDNAGVTGEHKSELELAMERGESPLTVSSAEEFDKLMNFVMHRPIPLPGFVKRDLCEKAIAHQAFWDSIFWALSDEIESQPLNDQLQNVVVPTLIIWGRQDRLIDVSCCDAMQANIRDCHCVIFENTGHIPMLERPAESAAEHLNFLDNYFAATT